MIRPANTTDAQSIADIYNWYVENTTITFEEALVSVADMRSRVGKADALHPWFVYEDTDELLGYAYATEFKPRSAYRYTVETTVYLHHKATGKGIGNMLYQHLIDNLRNTSVHCLIATIALPNAGSIALHKKLGFVKAGQLAEVGHKFERWVDVELWQRAFSAER